MTDRELLEIIAAQMETLAIAIEEVSGQVDRLVAWADSLMEAKDELEGIVAKGIN